MPRRKKKSKTKKKKTKIPIDKKPMTRQVTNERNEMLRLFNKYSDQARLLLPLMLPKYRLDVGLSFLRRDYEHIVCDRSDDFTKLFDTCDRTIIEIIRTYPSSRETRYLIREHSRMIKDDRKAFYSWERISEWGARKFTNRSYMKDQCRKKIILIDVLITNTYYLDYHLPKTKIYKRFMLDRLYDIAYCMEVCTTIIIQFLRGRMYERIKKVLLKDYCNIRDRYDKIQCQVYDSWFPGTSGNKKYNYFREILNRPQDQIKRRALESWINAISKKILLSRLIKLTGNCYSAAVGSLMLNILMDFVTSIEDVEPTLTKLLVHRIYDPDIDYITEFAGDLSRKIPVFLSVMWLNIHELWSGYVRGLYEINIRIDIGVN